MKKILLLLFALLGLALQGMAQTVIEFPQYTKILKVVSKGINVREEPSTQSAKLGNSPDMLLVVDEDAEWYHACIIKNGKILPKPGYVSKKVCRVIQPKSIDATYVKRAFEEQALQVANKSNGKYHGWTFISFRFFSLGWEECYCFVGKPVGNSFIGKLFTYQSTDDEVIIRNASSLSDGMLSVPYSRLEGPKGEDFTKLTDREVDKLLAFGSKDIFTILYAGKVSFEYSNGAYDPPTVESGEGVETIEVNVFGFQGAMSEY